MVISSGQAKQCVRFALQNYKLVSRGEGESGTFRGMDVEAILRRELVSALRPSFLCFEEIEIEHPLFQNTTVRADVIVIPTEEKFWAHALAFEVKCYDKLADYAKWSSAIKQASDYVLGRIQSDNHILSGRRVSASLVYPAPVYQPHIPRENIPPDISNLLMISGAFHCALHMRVGRARIDAREGLSLAFGPNEFWTERRGFTGQAQNLLKNKRPVGSRSVDVSVLLDGLSAEFPAFD